MKINNILQRANVKFYDGHGHHHARPGWVQIDCPFCGRDSKKFHMGYNIARGYFTCWKCGSHNFVSTVSTLLGISYTEAKELRSNVDMIKDTRRIKRSGTLKLPKGLGPLGKPHKRYLRRRGFTNYGCWQPQGIGLAARMAWRVFIPIHYKGEMVSWTTRSIRDKGLRYISASAEEEAMPHKDLLYGADFASNVVICVEGPLDVWSGGPGFVGTCGTGYSRAQLEKLSQYAVRAIWFDPGTAAQRRASDLVDQLSVFPGETYNIKTDTDPGETDARTILKVRKEIGL